MKKKSLKTIIKFPLVLTTLSLTTVLSVSGVNTFPFASTSSLFHGSKAEAAVTIRDDYVLLDMPQTGNQDDNWSCGPTSAARLINFYGHNVNRDTLVNAINRDFVIPPSFKVPAPTFTNPLNTRRVDIRTGTTPHALRDVMKKWEGNNVKLERKADFNNLVGLLRQGKPVIALLRVGSTKVLGTTWPVMHWVVVNGFSAPEQKIYYTETADGKTYEYSYDEFQSNWDWRVGTGLASEALHKNGVQSKTMIWVDRVPSEVLASNQPDLPSDISVSLGDGKVINYFRSTGAGTLARQDSGEIIQRYSGWHKSWDQIVAIRTDMVLFYDREDGKGEIYRIEPQGNLTFLYRYDGWRKTWSNISSLGNSRVRFVDDTNHSEIYSVNDQGVFFDAN